MKLQTHFIYLVSDVLAITNYMEIVAFVSNIVGAVLLAGPWYWYAIILGMLYKTSSPLSIQNLITTR